nr:AT rich interactive domain containing protein [Hymenolepis microstoma]
MFHAMTMMREYVVIAGYQQTDYPHPIMRSCCIQADIHACCRSLIFIMAGSPIRAPLTNLIFPQSEEKMMTGNTGSPISGIQSRSPTYSRFPEGPFFSENTPSSPPMKKRCLDVATEQEHLPQQKHQSTASSTGETTGTTQQTHDCSSDSLQTSSTSLSPKVERGSRQPQNQNGDEKESKQEDADTSKDMLQQNSMSLWGNILPDSTYPRISLFPKNFPPIFPPGCTATGTQGIPTITPTSQGEPVSLGTSALAAAAAMAMSPLFQNAPGGPGSTASPWNPMLAAAAAAFANGRFPIPGLPPRPQGEGECFGDKDGDSSPRSGSPSPLSGVGSSVECVEALPDSNQAGHHWTFQEQFKQLYELSPDPKRKEFLDDLFNFMQKRGSPVNRIPIMAKQVLDLYELYRLVVTRGGLVEVINKKLWREITKGLQLPSSITSAAFTLRTQYMKYLYPYECEKLNLSTPNELQAAIDGNRREARRSSYSFDYPMLMGPCSSAGATPNSAGQPIPSNPLGTAFPQSHLSHHSLLNPGQPLLAPPCSVAQASMLPPGLLLPPGFSSQNASRNGNILGENPFFGFPGMSVSTPNHNALVIPTSLPSNSSSLDSKTYLENDQLMKQKQAKGLQRSMSSLPSTMTANDVATNSRPNSKSNYSSPATLETGLTSEGNHQKKPINFEIDQRQSQQRSSSPHLKENMDSNEGTHETTSVRFSEFLKQRMPSNEAEETQGLNFAMGDIMQNACQIINMSTPKLQSSSDKRGAMNEFADDRRTTKMSAPIQENGDFSNCNMQSASNMRISTQTGSQLGLPDNTLVVCMEIAGVVYQGVLFGQIKTSA